MNVQTSLILDEIGFHLTGILGDSGTALKTIYSGRIPRRSSRNSGSWCFYSNIFIHINEVSI